MHPSLQHRLITYPDFIYLGVELGERVPRIADTFHLLVASYDRQEYLEPILIPVPARE